MGCKKNSHNCILSFPLQVEEGDEGRYLCEAENGVNDPLAAVVNLKVNGKRKQTKTVARIRILLSGHSM